MIDQHPGQTANPSELSRVIIKPQGLKRWKSGHPWVFSNDVVMSPDAKAIAPGSVVSVAAGEGGVPIGRAFFNRHALIALRRLDEAQGALNVSFFEERLTRARDLRDGLIEAPHYRLIHAEADGLPGLIIDRFGDVFVVQVNTAGMEVATPLLLDALERVFEPRVIVLKNDSAARAQEGLSQGVSLAKGTLYGPIEVQENGMTFFADPREGQKTGWFFDQRENRAWASRLAKGKRVLDCYSFTGGFGLQAAFAGAAKVTLLDRSELALDLAKQSAEANGLAEICRFNKGDAFNRLELLGDRKESFELVMCDPPAFVKAKKDLARGQKAYRKLARLGARLVAPGGNFVICSCSHHMEAGNFLYQVARGIADAGRTGRLLRQSGAGPDHPLHPNLAESGYLKALFFSVD